MTRLTASKNNSQLLSIALTGLLLGAFLGPLKAEDLSALDINLDSGALAYISNDQGVDAIMVQDGRLLQKAYRCQSESEMILTPSIDYWQNNITFVIDNGQPGRTIYGLALSGSETQKWGGEVRELATLPEASWPTAGPDGSIYLVMPDESNLKTGKVTGLFQLNDGSIRTIHSAEQRFKYYWPLISPTGSQLFYRQSIAPQSEVKESFWSRMILRDLNTGAQTFHFVDEPIYLEQWSKTGIIYSTKMADEARTRVYRLYDPSTGAVRELFRGSVWQARFNADLTQVAVIRPEPPSDNFFDVFVIELATHVEQNITNTPQISESLIGWLSARN